MAYYELKLTANKPYIQDTPGTIILVDSLGDAQGVDVTPIYRGAEQARMKNRQAGFKYVTPFDGMKFQAAVDTTIAVFLTNNEVSLGFANGAAVNVRGSVTVDNDAANRVPVDLAGGTVNVTATNVGINNTDANAVPVRDQALGTIVDHAPAVINTGLAQLLVNDPTFRRLRIRNASATAVIALGGSAVTLANAAIVLQPGDVWLEDDVAGAPWYAISDTNGADVRVMGLKP
jgi:hypothetical protein